MPYAAQPRAAEGDRQALAEARWRALAAARPDLEPAVELQRQLLGAVLHLTATIEKLGAPRLSLPPRYLTAKLGAEIPALVGEPIQVPAATLTPTLVALCTCLSERGGEAGRALRLAIDGGQLDLPALLTLTLRRQQAAIRVVATRASVGHDLLWLVTDLAVGPFAHALRASLFDAAPSGSPVLTALETWTAGYCPLCGSWPGFAEMVGTRRVLRCAFCAAGWEGPPGACTYCGGATELRGSDSMSQARAIETCSSCRGYLKRIAADAPMPFPLLPVVDLESMDLDLAAIGAGFARPALKSFGAR